MYCSNCGAAASGNFGGADQRHNFCSVCGFALTKAGAGVQIVPMASEVPPLPTAPASWDDEVRYEVIVAVPEVRNRIAANAATARTPMTGEKFLELCDKAFAQFGGVSVATVATLAAPIYSRLGVNTGKTRTQSYQRPAGRVLADLLCFLAGSGYGVKRVQQGEDGCVLECTLPSDWRSFAADLIVTVERADAGTGVQAATKIPGQLYDWGKSKQVLDRLFADLART